MVARGGGGGGSSLVFIKIRKLIIAGWLHDYIRERIGNRFCSQDSSWSSSLTESSMMDNPAIGSYSQSVSLSVRAEDRLLS